MSRKIVSIILAVLLLCPYLSPLALTAQQVDSSPRFNPLSEGVIELNRQALPQSNATEKALSGAPDVPLPYDWYQEYNTRFPSSPFDPANNPPLPNAENHQTFMAYDVGRYSIPAAVYMYQATKDTHYLEAAREQINSMFSPSYFQDGTNGANDGFLGWRFSRSDGINHVTGGIPKNVWQHTHVRVEDLNATQTKVSLTINGQTFQETTNAYYDSGTIALLSGWAKTSFKNIVIRDLRGAVLYNLNSEGGSFANDWERVSNPSSANDTGLWSIQLVQEAEETEFPETPIALGTYVISSDSTTNTPTPFFYPFDPQALYNFGKPASGAADGKYSALVFKRPGFENRRSYEVEFDIRLEKRNWGGAEQGLGVRYHAPSGQLFSGYRVTPPPLDPNQYPPVGTRNTYFMDYARHIGNLFFTTGVRIAHDDDYGFFLGGPTWLAGGGTEKFLHNPKYQELAAYDGGATQGALEFIYTVYKNRLEEFYPAADDFLRILQNNIIAKWYSKANLSTPDFVLGGGTNLNHGGTYKWATDIRFEVQFMGFYKLARDFPERWRSVTEAHPSPVLPNVDVLAQFYEDHFRSAARSFIDASWIRPGTDYYQWWGAGFNRSYWGEFSLWGSDLQHNSYTMSFMAEAYHYGFISKDEFDTLARTFTKKIWNGQSDPATINMGNGQPNPNFGYYAVDIHGVGDARVNIGYTTAHVADYFPLLAESDFKVYEIFNTWLQYFAWNHYTNPWGWWHVTRSFYGIHPSMMLYAVKFGRPRNLQVKRVDSGNLLYWNHPSDWPGGTTLQYYNVYRRELNQPWPQDPIGTVSTTELQYVDDYAEKDQVYLYKITAQDNTQAFRNESDPSNIIAVKNGELTGGFALHAAPGNGEVSLFWHADAEQPVQYEVMQWIDGQWVSLDFTGANSYTVTHLENGATYWFRVRESSAIEPPFPFDEAISATPGNIYVIRQPQSRVVCPGWSVEFATAARGAEPINIQWQQSSDGGNTWQDLAGQHNPSFRIESVQAAHHNRRYRAAFRTSTGWVYSNVALLTISSNCPAF